jgi:hypothetical protein
VYVLASHSHFYSDHIFKTPDWKGKELPGWIVGTAGAVRYKLPPEASPDQHAQTNVYGYLIATVVADGTVSFEFQQLDLATLLKVNRPAYAERLIQWCYENNKQ